MARDIPPAIVHHKGCNSATCCSPSRLWRTLRSLIQDNQVNGLLDFFKDPRLEHIMRVALSSRLSNDPSLYPPSHRHMIIRLPSETQKEGLQLLGRTLTDLNIIQYALLVSSESMVLSLLSQLKLHATEHELKQLVNHLSGQGNTSLHLAAFLNRSRVIKVLLDLGAKDGLNMKLKMAKDCCRNDKTLQVFEYFDSVTKRKASAKCKNTHVPALHDSTVFLHQDVITMSTDPSHMSVQGVATVAMETINIQDETVIIEKGVALPLVIPLVRNNAFPIQLKHYLFKSLMPAAYHRHYHGVLPVQLFCMASQKKPPDINTAIHPSNDPLSYVYPFVRSCVNSFKLLCYAI